MGLPKTIIFLCLTLPFIQSCSRIPVQLPDLDTNDKEDAYLGVAYSEATSGTGLKITRVLPGPLRQALSKSLRVDIKNDRLMRINSETVNAKTLKQIISEYRSGQTIVLHFQKGAGSPGEEEFISLNVTLGSKSQWTGPISKAYLIGPFDKRKQHLPALSDKNRISRFINSEVNKYTLREDINKLYALFFEWQKNNKGFHSLSRVMFPFQQPEYLFEVETTITKPLADLHNQPNKLFKEIAANLDLIAPINKSCDAASTKYQQWDALIESIIVSNEFLHKAFNKINKTILNAADDGFVYLLSELSSLKTLDIQIDPIKSLNAINMSMQIDFNALLSSATELSCFMSNDLIINLSSRDNSKNIPSELRNAIHG